MLFWFGVDVDVCLGVVVVVAVAVVRGLAVVRAVDGGAADAVVVGSGSDVVVITVSTNSRYSCCIASSYSYLRLEKNGKMEM